MNGDETQNESDQNSNIYEESLDKNNDDSQNSDNIKNFEEIVNAINTQQHDKPIKFIDTTEHSPGEIILTGFLSNFPTVLLIVFIELILVRTGLMREIKPQRTPRDANSKGAKLRTTKNSNSTEANNTAIDDTSKIGNAG